MWEQFAIGSSFAFAAAILPGPLQTFLLASVLRSGWKRTLPAAFAPVISDGPIAVLMLLVLTRLPEALGRTLQAAGGLFLVYLAWTVYRQWRQAPAPEAEAGEAPPRTLLQAVVVNVLNPNPYLGWSLVLGPACVKAWHRSPAAAVALVASFYVTMVSVMIGLIVLFGATRFLGPGVRRGLVLASALTLAGLGAWRLVTLLPL
jgi:threonine/homoserine/homoserine lactone efflux protein